jgi:hypothetical protein
MEPSVGRTRRWRFGMAEFGIFIGLITFAIGMVYIVVNPPPSWIAAAVWLLIVAGCSLIVVWFWDKTADRHYSVRAILTIAVLTLVYLFGCHPIYRLYLAQRNPTPREQTATKGDIADMERLISRIDGTELPV